MRRTQTQLNEIEIKLWREGFAIPVVELKVLQVIPVGCRRLIPISKQRGSKINALSIPALLDHVDLFANLLLHDLNRRMGIGDVVESNFTVIPSVHPKVIVIG